MKANVRVLCFLLLVLALPTVLVVYSVPLYRLFCAATGYGGATRRADSVSTLEADRMVTVRFSTDHAPDLPWLFVPKQGEVTVRLGEPKLVYFIAQNNSDEPIVAHATFNVTPEKAGEYFYKVQCFCFDEERLQPHERVEMPVQFYVDTEMSQDRNADDVQVITLAYTFFRSRSPEEGKDLNRLTTTDTPDADLVAAGEALFGKRCATCHALDANRAGPALGSVFGRRAGSEPGYHYSPALEQAVLTWDKETLDRWLQGPRQFIDGARMPVSVASADERREIIAYLHSLSSPGQASGTRSAANSGAAL